MREPIHFKSQDERLAYLNGGFEEIVPQKVEKASEKTEKPKKTTKKGAKKDEVQAE